MAFLDHIARCNAHDMGKFRPFLVDRRHVGWVRHDHAQRFRDFADTFHVTDDGVVLHPRLDTPGQRSEAVDAVCAALAQDGVPPPRGERFAVLAAWGDAPMMTIDRAHASLFGIRAFGVHVNGFVADGAGIRLWIGHRAEDRAICPGKLDNMIAGGQPAGLTLAQNLVKEAEEEAGLSRDLALTARPVGAVSYCLEDEWGLKPDTMFCFDLLMPAGREPRNQDGEVARFELMDMDHVVARLRDTDDFKYNVPLVVLDFLVRHGILRPDDEPEYMDVVNGLRRGW